MLAPYHLADTLAHLAGCLRTAYSGADILYRHYRVNAVLVDESFHQMWPDVFAVVGQRIVDRQGEQRREFRIVSVSLAGQVEMAGSHGDVIAAAVVVDKPADPRGALPCYSRPYRLEESQTGQPVVPFLGILGISAEYHAGNTGVGRLLDHLLHVLHAAAVRIAGAHERGAVHQVVDALHQPVLEGYHQRDGFHHRTRLEGEDRPVQGLAVSAVIKKLHIRNGLDLACGNLHQYGCAPFRSGVDAYLGQFLLEHILQVDVDGGENVVTAARRRGHPVAEARGQSHLLGQSVMSVQQRVEVLFQTRISVDFLGCGILVDTADAAVSHLSVRIDAFVAGCLVERSVAGLGPLVDKREVAYALHILERSLGNEPQSARALLRCLLELSFQFRMPRVFGKSVRVAVKIRASRIVLVERVGKRADRILGKHPQ